VLASYGITAAAVGCPIRSSMDVVELGRAGDTPVYFDRTALEADLAIPINRVRRHSGFRGRYESGLAKMLGFGFGNHDGAVAGHARGWARLAEQVPEMARVILARANIGFGIAIVENADDTLALVEAVPADALLAREPALLELATRLMPRIGIPELDVLIVDALGKDISEAGMDANVTGRSVSGLVQADIRYRALVALRLSAGTRGNATGMGFADVVSQKLVDAIDWRASYTNCAAAGALAPVRMPVAMATDRDAIALGLAIARGDRVVRIASTKHLDTLWVSASLAAAGTCEVLGDPEPMSLEGP
jgi:hypothetical protein